MKAREYIRRWNNISDETKDRRKKLKKEVHDLPTMRYLLYIVKFLPLIIISIPVVLIYLLFYGSWND